MLFYLVAIATVEVVLADEKMTALRVQVMHACLNRDGTLSIEMSHKAHARFRDKNGLSSTRYTRALS